MPMVNPLSNFSGRHDEQAGEVLMRINGEFVPLTDVSAFTGFCEVLDRNSIIPNVTDTATEFEALDIDHLIRFRLRNGNLIITVQVKDVENVVCGGQIAGDVEVFDLKVSPPQRIVFGPTDFIDLPNNIMGRRLEQRINQMLVVSADEIAAGNGEIGVTGDDLED
ncbi:MAG: hypothetical protein R3F37_18385 [Candidatus Competibacteraceae bacterium]